MMRIYPVSFVLVENILTKKEAFTAILAMRANLFFKMVQRVAPCVRQVSSKTRTRRHPVSLVLVENILTKKEAFTAILAMRVNLFFKLVQRVAPSVRKVSS